MKAKRIWIFGGTASGKTTFTEKLSKKLKIPHYNTDFMKYNKTFTKKYSRKIKERKIIELSRKKKWLCEGTNFGEWVWPALKKSELVIILKTNPFLRMKRLLKREIKDRKRKLKLKKKLSLTYHVFLYNLNQYYSHKKTAKKFKKPIIVLKNDKQIKQFLKDLK
tara:strand:+ start:79 stop:570 length:492 start_codon:yes stop_codon:yes gene_type:complete